MKKKATLLIKNLHKVYTMEDNQNASSFLTNAFIAIHHDEILDVGTHDYQYYVDKDTRILDGINHIAIPSFIEPNAHMSKQECSCVREQHEYCMRFMHHGTVTIHTNEVIQETILQHYQYEVLQHQTTSSIPIVNAITQFRESICIDTTKPFCISTNDTHIALQSQMMAAQLLAMKEEIDAYTLLKSITTHPANYLQLTNYGRIKKGYIANILIICTSDIHAFFYSLDQHCIAHIIHKGVRIFPNLLI